MSEIFEPFQKIARLLRDCVVTEKLDGTNASIAIADDGTMRFGSRTRWITPEDDNFGFARWAHDHAAELSALGPGHHFGEWWGSGIQRKYGIGEKRFSLFNTSRWNAETPPPACCHVVPVLHAGPFDTIIIIDVMARLAMGGSVAAPGFDKPEGVVVYHMHAGQYFKATFDGDGHKGTGNRP